MIKRRKMLNIPEFYVGENFYVLIVLGIHHGGKNYLIVLITNYDCCNLKLQVASCQ